MTNSLNKLMNWRHIFMTWQLGNREKGDHEGDAVVHHRGLSMLLRAESSALAALLIQKGVFTATEFTTQVHVEAEHLDGEYSKMFPGYSSADDGMVVMLPEALVTAKRFGLTR